MCALWIVHDADADADASQLCTRTKLSIKHCATPATHTVIGIYIKFAISFRRERELYVYACLLCTLLLSGSYYHSIKHNMCFLLYERAELKLNGFFIIINFFSLAHMMCNFFYFPILR